MITTQKTRDNAAWLKSKKDLAEFHGFCEESEAGKAIHGTNNLKEIGDNLI